MKLIDAKKAETELRGVRRELEGTTGATTKGGKAAETAAKGHGVLSRAVGGLGTTLRYAGGFVGIYGLAEGIKGVVEGGIQANEQHLLLQNALRATGQTGAGAYGQINAAIAKSSSAGGFNRLQETEGIAQLTRETGSYTTALRENQAVVTLSRGLHQGYATTLGQVQRLETGTPGRLTKLIGPYVAVKTYVDQLTASQKKRYPELLKEAELRDKEATALQLNQRIQERYGSAVVAYNNSAAGAITNARNAFSNAEEELGEKLAPVIKEVAVGFSHVVTELTKGEGVWKTVDQVAGTFGETLKTVWTYFEKNKTAANALFYAMGALAGVWATEKVLGYVKAVKELLVIEKVTAAVKALSAANFASAESGLAGIGKYAGPLAGVALAADSILSSLDVKHPTLAHHSLLSNIGGFLTGGANIPGIGHIGNPGTSPLNLVRQLEEGGHAPHTALTGVTGGTEAVVIHTHVKIQERDVAEAVTRYALKRKARE